MTKQNRRGVVIDLSKPADQQITRPKASKHKQHENKFRAKHHGLRSVKK